MARTISGISQPIGVGDPFFIDGKAYYSTPTSINTLDDKSLAEYQSQGKQIPNLTPEESDTFFKYLLSSSASSQPFAVNSYRDLRLSQDQYQGYLSGQQVGTPDLIRADLGQTVNPAGKTEAQGAPLYYGDPKAEAERQRNAAAPAISPRYETYQTSKGVVDTNGNVVGSAQAGSSPQPSLMEGTSYTVKPGDTLSAIAKQLGVPMASITGYRSGNPNLIYPGEKLSIAGTGMMGGGTTTTPQTGGTNGGTSGITDSGSPPPSAPPQNAPPTPSPGDFTKTYTDTLNKLGISSIKSQFDKVNKEFETLQNELNDKIVEINDDPWISEGLRVERIRKEEERYEGKLNIKSNQLKLYDSLYQQGLAEARYLTTGEVAQEQWAYEQAQKVYEADAALDLELLKLSKKGGYESGIIGEYQFAQEQGYEGTFSQYQNEDANRKKSIAAAGASGLTPGQINSTVNSIAGAFDNEQIVKDYNQATSQYNLMSSLGTQGKNPGDDIAFVYAFAKLMDPNSVVREGEYETIKRFAQSFLDAKTLEAIRLAKNVNFLSADAKQKLLTTAAAKLKVLESQYNQISSEYQRQVDDAYAGKPRQITQYSQPEVSDNDALRQQVAQYGYDYDALLADGNSDEEIKRAIENELNMSIAWQ